MIEGRTHAFDIDVTWPNHFYDSYGRDHGISVCLDTAAHTRNWIGGQRVARNGEMRGDRGRGGEDKRRKSKSNM